MIFLKRRKLEVDSFSLLKGSLGKQVINLGMKTEIFSLFHRN